MKAVCTFLTLILLVCYSTHAMQALENTCSSEQTFYNQRIDQLLTNEQGVFLLVDGHWYGALGVQAASEGIFVLEDGEWIPLNEAIKCGSKYLWWKCPNEDCGKYNPQNVRYCLYCGRDRFS